MVLHLGEVNGEKRNLDHVMNRWLLSRLLLLTVLALFPLAYFVPGYWTVQPNVYYERMPEDNLQDVRKIPLVAESEGVDDPFAIAGKSGSNGQISQLGPYKLELAANALSPLALEPGRPSLSEQSISSSQSTAATADIKTWKTATSTRVLQSTTVVSTSVSSQSKKAASKRTTDRAQEHTQPVSAASISDDELSNPTFRAEYEKLACKFPMLDPWDDSIMPFLSHPQPLDCLKVQAELTYVDSDGCLRFNENEYRKAVYTFGNLSCFYRHFDKLDENDHSLMYVDGGTFFEPPTVVRLTHPTVEVKCERTAKTPDKTFGNEVYWSIHAHPLMATNKSLKTYKTEHPSLSVLIIGVDSISLSAFRRHLPLTYAYLRDVMRFHIFRGHHKIGDNSFPNQMAVLLGKRVVNESWPDMMDEVREDYSHIRFDHWPLLWKSFAEKGYETSFNEDTPHWGLFHYFMQGFAKKPVHHYYHQYWLALHRGERRYQKYCFGNKAKLELQLDLVRKHLVLGKDRKWFDYVFATELFHQDEGYEAEKADPYFLKFFKEMYEGGYFNQTAVVFMSDHGHRYASLRQTLVGLIEERLPMFNAWFPEWFYKGNDFYETLRLNTVRLTTHFDVHETLLDILDNNYKSSQRPPGARAHSLLYPISHDRTCSQAGIPAHYCTCLSEKTIPANDSSSVEAVNAAVIQLNLIVANSSLCSPLSLSKILRVEQLGVNEKIARGVSDMKSAREFDAETGAPAVRRLNKLRVTFSTEPGNALFEAITAWNNWKSVWVVDGRIHRLNAYAATAHCIHDRYLASYCICDRSVS